MPLPLLFTPGEKIKAAASTFGGWRVEAEVARPAKRV